MKRLALLALAACGSSSPRPAQPAADQPDAGVVAAPDDDTTPDVLVVQGKSLRKQGDGDGSAQAVVRFRLACDRDYGVGCEVLGETLTDWQYYAIAQDDQGAAVAYDRGCNLGNARACYRYGFYLIEGLLGYVVDGGEVRRVNRDADHERAVGLVQRGCDLGEAEACKFLGKP